MARISRHDAGTRLHFLNGIHIEVGKCSAAEFRIGGIRSIHREDRRGAPLAVDGKLLCKIRRAVGVRHRAGRQQQELAKVAFIQRQAGHFTGGEMFAATGLGQSRILSNHDTKLLPLLRELKTGCACAAVFDHHGIRNRPNLARRTYREYVIARRNRGKRELAGCGSCSGILALALPRHQLDGSHPDRISCRVAQNTPPGICQRTAEKRNLYEYQDKYEGTSECAGPRKHRESLYAR